MGIMPMFCLAQHARTVPAAPSLVILEGSALLEGPDPLGIPSPVLYIDHSIPLTNPDWRQHGQASRIEAREPDFLDSGLSFALNLSGSCS